MAEGEEAACREEILPFLLLMLKGSVAAKSMAVGRTRSSPDAVGEEKMRSAGLYCAPNSKPSASPPAYLPWKDRSSEAASHLRQIVARRSCLATRPQPVEQAAMA
eukprot:Plantae.Rhodophyta-Palmaria_palmata.ctg14022.p3 GENE.Plantae.Rhodophyta-Palmaria_palmata.ctg14022~~Plantae.Rhodophyta-Palmaria_palmata.ctg14022.p3  ORF type:complete len:105 (-),score=9.23 Plantae.Rhodophyta-Palmaria_palmata.ctg14022:157-471(-)